MSSKREETSSPTEAAPSKRRSKRLFAVEVPSSSSQPPLPWSSRIHAAEEDDDGTRFIGEPISPVEARSLWPHRYQDQSTEGNVAGSKRKPEDDSDETIQAKRHYSRAEVDGTLLFDLDDDAHAKAEEGREDYICRIVEIFEAIDGSRCFTAQWYYRPTDTVIMNTSSPNNKRVFFSEVKNVNLLNSLTKKLNIVRLPLNVDLSVTEQKISNCDYYCDMIYLLPHSSFLKLRNDNIETESESESTVSSEDEAAAATVIKSDCKGVSSNDDIKKTEMKLLDLYSGCGAMSTGLCHGANMFGVNLVTKWAVDLNEHACQSLKYNHPETEVRNEAAGDFLSLLKAWRKLCAKFLIGCEVAEQDLVVVEDENVDNDAGGENDEVYEVEEVLDICYGDPNVSGKRRLYMKIRWKGYGVDEDSWEPYDTLGGCEERIKEFVTRGHKSKMLPLPGDVDVICGGPPCQGISGFNRFRNKEEPLQDPKNEQVAVFMNLVEYLQPRFVLMENVVDLVKFADGFLGRYALGRLVSLNYQARLGLMAAGSYGLPQFRMRVFLWGARPTEKLPQFPLPTHNVVKRGVIPSEFESSTVAYNDGHDVKLEKELFLEDAISDLPAVENGEERDEMTYASEPKNDFQRFIRLRRDELNGSEIGSEVPKNVLFDHRPLRLNNDDYHRVCEIPKRKGANFRDLRGVRVGSDNKVEWDPNVERVYLPSGKPLVPDYAMSFIKGASSKPFGRLWWDQTVPTVVTRAEPHNQTILHPEQDRVLTVRENARLQGFPDYYRLFGPIKQRYMQVGNAVAVPVSRALGYALAVASSKEDLLCDEEPLLTLPKNFPNILKCGRDTNTYPPPVC